MADRTKLTQFIAERTGRFPDSQSVVLEALHFANSADGIITKESVEIIAAALNMTPIRVWGVATFYTMYNKKPVGKYLVQVCTNIACSLRGGYSVLTNLEETLGIRVGETTKDGRFTLIEVECLGACGNAPVMQINDNYYENCTKEKVDAVIKALA
ncbi:MAG: NAD(P)H-dependent oxidoreductase subunit E [Spirochaetes bacterium]|nr:NAD(P)H-dependent oxidoreductase subunit E [Spirochaetota bacterium]